MASQSLANAELPFDPCFKINLGHTKKLLYLPYNWLRALSMQTTYRKSWSVNLLQVSNLTFDPCFKVK